MGKRQGAAKASPTARMMINPETYPALSAILDSSDGNRVRDELEALLGHPVKQRAPRKPVKRIARLMAARYDDVVMLKDLSSSGVRLLLQGDQPLDLREMATMDLIVKLPGGRHVLPIAAVRFCGLDGSNMDIACRFIGNAPDLAKKISDIRSLMFD